MLGYPIGCIDLGIDSDWQDRVIPPLVDPGAPFVSLLGVTLTLVLPQGVCLRCQNPQPLVKLPWCHVGSDCWGWAGVTALGGGGLNGWGHCA